MSEPKRAKDPQHTNEDQENGVRRVTQDEFREFISAPYSIIWAGPFCGPSNFPYALKFRLGDFHSPRVKLGTVDFTKIEWTATVKLWIAIQLSQTGIKVDELGRPPVGFYLFAKGAFLGFFPTKIDPEKDSALLWVGGIAGIFAAFNNSLPTAQFALQMATWNMGERVAEAFEELIGKHLSDSPPEPESSQQSTFEDFDEPLVQAYAALGLTPNASDREVSTAHKRLIMEHHPDRAPKSEAAQKKAHRRTAEINAARDAIRKHRGQR
ncbi:DnaJ family molecular chaperone [Corallococcus sp. CA054B]|uniref:J domain-containing protein n=1 Tax=Corallococcus sp. CA054B TaxID=2316734 RepID=UPI0013154696|nr:DnaJ domain-containing protein [Corallococcus sp. CA054B]